MKIIRLRNEPQAAIYINQNDETPATVQHFEKRTKTIPRANAPSTALPARRSRGLLPRLRDAFAVAEQRHRLAQLDNARLSDLGLTRAEAEAEARRPLWDLPQI